MKNLLTLLLLGFSLLAFGQSNSQSIELEIKYWKSIAESNDTVAYREYLNRYGEDGLYKDEAITRIALLKTSRKQAQSKSIECCFYKGEYLMYGNNKFVVRFESNQDKVWIKSIDHDTVRSYLSISRDFYEDQAILALSRGTREYENAIWIDKKAMEEAEYAKKYEKNRRKKSEILQKAEQAKSQEYYNNAWTADEEYEYVPMKSTSARDVYFKRDKLYQIKFEYYYKNNTNNCIYIYPDYVYTDEYNHEYYQRVKRDGRFETVKTMQGYRYIAISKDKSSFIMWFEEDENLDGQIFEKRNYYRVPKEDLLPKVVNYDFLNE